MARPNKTRKVGTPPIMKGFKPFGMPLCKLSVIQLSYEEYESLRLVNYQMLPQEQAAEMMNVSRPTLTRIYNKAINTIAEAFIEGKAIEIAGGTFVMDKDWYRCKKCNKLIEGIENHTRCVDCKMFSDSELIKLSPS